LFLSHLISSVSIPPCFYFPFFVSHWQSFKLVFLSGQGQIITSIQNMGGFYIQQYSLINKESLLELGGGSAALGLFITNFLFLSPSLFSASRNWIASVYLDLVFGKTTGHIRSPPTASLLQGNQFLFFQLASLYAKNIF